MDGPRRSKVAVAHRLPDDALVEILSCLPAKFLCRFKCVSRSWCDLIADRLGCKNLPQTLEGFLYFNREDHDGGDGEGGRCGGDEGNGDVRELTLSSRKILHRRGYAHFINLLGKSVPLLDRSFSFVKKQRDIKVRRIALLDSCNGLLLFGNRRVSDTYDSLGYIVCNPATEQSVAVPSSGWTPSPPQGSEDALESDVRSFLIFDPAVSLDFQLVQFWQDGIREDVEGVHTYSSETGLWSDRSSEWKRGEEGGEWEQWGHDGHIIKPIDGRSFVNGMLHFLVYQIQTEKFVIVAVDGQGKTCKIIPWPMEYLFPDPAFIGQSQGRLLCISGLGKQKAEGHDVQFTGLSIWALEDYDTEQWVQKHNVSFLQLFGRISCEVRIDYDVVAISSDRNLVFFVQHWNRKLISYDMDSKEVCALRTLGHGYPCITLYVPSFKSLALAYKH